MTQTAQKRLKRLKAIVSLYEEKREALSQVRQMQQWIMRLEHIFDGSWTSSPEEISNAEVARRFDEWLKELASFLQAEERTQEEQLRLGHLLKVMSQLPTRSGTSLRPGRFSTHEQRHGDQHSRP